ncbi:FAD-binding domain-containing protein [Fomitiporia mediterranea MF3/22]|uniref:FAD-binding domain-containing protein n=1 Tax=Fomitiporia mediterranea (strain MF3/22) TaxID=694068 RepID=UPI000440834B|nr:FAD-binding domain-containing protein [Fomitiporia mediterranea MF3/22]EJD05537.1 FAD-binding domain-containing protein [Fomitiporia mediterranea MF3/22]
MSPTGFLGVFTTFAALLVGRTSAFASSSPRADNEDYSRAYKACQLLQATVPKLVSFPGSEQYVNDTEHWAVSSQQNSTCSIEPTSADDVGTIIGVLGRSDIRSPFAVKSGGHAYNLGQSSTPGVQISMAQFKNITYDAEQGTVMLGVGLTWGEVYERLEPLGVMVAGGRISGVGVGGYSLGGGYSWKTNQYGLLIDTVVSHDLVLPSGEFIHVTNATNPDLFFGLRGGLNNFGIVTSITVEAHNQSLVYGGTLTYSMDAIQSLNEAISNFSLNNTDPKAQIIPVYASVSNQFISQILLFYDGPTPAPGVYDEILSIPTVQSDIQTRTFVNLMSLFGNDLGIGPFGVAQHTVPIVHYPKPVLDEMVTQVVSFGEQLSAQHNGSTVIVSIAPEPFFNPFSHSRGGAYPHPPSRQVTPASAYFAYQEDPSAPLPVRIAHHNDFVDAIKSFTHNIQAKAVSEGVSRWDDISYPNYALSDTPLDLLYGSNVPRLQQLAAQYDPDGVMALTGGFRFQE